MTMRQFYSLSKTLSIFLILLGSVHVKAQLPTTVTTSNTCAVVQDFNTTGGGFTTPSIYSDQYDYSMTWNGAGPGGMLVRSNTGVFAPYQASVISPQFPNTALNGTAQIGFSYSAPAGTYYRIRVIRPNAVTGTEDIVAITSEGPPLPGGNVNWRELPAGSGTICLNLQDGDLVTGQILRYEFVFYVTSTAAPVTFDNFALSSIVPSPLPVTFLGVSAFQTNTGVLVRWDVAEEVDVKEYQLEKSTDGASFSTVKTVVADEKSVYSTTDASPKLPVVYYRIKSVDLDGSTKHSGIIKLSNGSSYASQVKVYPSPARSMITVQHRKLSAGARVTISTTDGRMVKSMVPANGTSNTMVDVSTLSAGMYVLRLDQGNGTVESTTFIKQ